jgi:hypothetical protein
MLRKILILLFVMMCFVSPAKALDVANVCLKETIKAEKKNNIRAHLLSTIAVVESGRWDNQTHEYVAWPWTINANGQGMFFPTKSQAIAKTKQLLKNGVKSIDVGCMQINLKYHGKEFSSLEQAFNPSENVAYAAKFLKTLHKNSGQWLEAATHYHSKEVKKGKKYESKIISVFEKIYNDIKKGKKLVSKQKNKIFAKYLIVTPKVKKITLAKKQKEKEFALNWRQNKLAEYMKNKRKKLKL